MSDETTKLLDAWIPKEDGSPSILTNTERIEILRKEEGGKNKELLQLMLDNLDKNDQNKGISGFAGLNTNDPFSKLGIKQDLQTVGNDNQWDVNK